MRADEMWEAMAAIEKQLCRGGERAAWRRLLSGKFTQAIDEHPYLTAEELISLLLDGLPVPR